ncbi:MAG TPA: hypothetical protein V6C78_13275 [Crinalium sp.]|jgi:hypothetical protein
MIDRLVQSALQTGWLSVESEGLLRQMVTVRKFQANELVAIETLYDAIRQGLVKREARGSSDSLPLPEARYSTP